MSIYQYLAMANANVWMSGTQMPGDEFILMAGDIITSSIYVYIQIPSHSKDAWHDAAYTTFHSAAQVCFFNSFFRSFKPSAWHCMTSHMPHPTSGNSHIFFLNRVLAMPKENTNPRYHWPFLKESTDPLTICGFPQKVSYAEKCSIV